MTSSLRAGGLFALMLGVVATATAADWPNFLGPNHNGSSPEKGLLTTWPAGGPKVLWKVEGGDGYSGIAVVGKRAYTMVGRGDDEFAIALDVADGKEVWKRRTGELFTEAHGNGPRATPAVDGDFVYFQSASGPLVCLKTADGSVVWEHDLLKEFKAKNITWGLCASPLIEGDLVIAIPGATGAGVAAFNKKDGKVVWKTSDDKAAYASPMAVTVDGKRQIIFFTAAGLLTVAADSGKELWRMPWVTDYDVNIATPLVIGDQLFVSSGEKVGCALLKLKGTDAPGTTWESKGERCVMMTYWANAVAHDKHLYGLSGEYNKQSTLACVDLATGKATWTEPRFGLGALTLADGHLFMVTITGDLVLAPANSKKYEEKARLKGLLTKGRYSVMPTIADKKLYLRDTKHVFCLDIAGK